MRATPNLSLIEPKYTWMKGHGKVRAPPADIGLDLPSDEELEQIRRDRLDCKHLGDPWTEREDEILYNLMKICPGGWDSAAQVLQRSVAGIRWRYYHCARPKFSHESANREEQRASEHKQPEESGTSSSCLRSPGESLIQVPEMEEVTTKKVSFPEFEYRRTDLRCNYGKRKDKDKLDPLFEAFRVQTRLPDGFMPHTMGLTEIPHGTLKGWRRKLAKDPTRDLLKNGHSGRSSVLDKDTERRIYDIVVGEIRAHRCVTARRVQDIANNITAEKRLQCKNGRTWLRGFLKRWNLSLRKAHLKRRPAPNDEIVAEFVENFELALFQYCHEAIINMDETSWHVFNGKEIKTVAQKGADGVTIDVKFDEKKCITVIAAITVAGERLPLWFISKGKTVLCEKKYREHEVLQEFVSQGKIIIAHTESGWSTAPLMQQYLDWLTERFEYKPLYLLWDVHASHRNDKVVEHAKSRDITPCFIPAGGTGQWQPLDVAVFGLVKIRAMRRMLTSNRSEDYTIYDALVDLAEVWYDDSTACSVKRAWEHLIEDDTTTNHDTDEESDGYFEVTSEGSA